ncbi:hypothetical protein V1507DRAFT_36697, partial [Lipomyces tetrasporus]
MNSVSYLRIIWGSARRWKRLPRRGIVHPGADPLHRHSLHSHVHQPGRLGKHAVHRRRDRGVLRDLQPGPAVLTDRRLQSHHRHLHPHRRPSGRWFGNKRVFVIGMTWYALWSLVAGLAVYSTHVFFVFARVFQGMGPALTLPNGLAILGQSYSPGQRKNISFSWFA